MSPNTKTGVPITVDEGEMDDPDFEPYQLSSKSILLNIWKKGQRLLESFWKIWQGDYLLSLGERLKLKLKLPRIEANETPRIWDIVQLKEDLPRGSWKLGKIVELITSNDGNIRAAKVLLPTKNVVNRSLNLLYPLECEHEHRQMSREILKIEQTDPNIKENRENKKLTVILSNEHKSNDKDESKINFQRTTRKAAREAKDRILRQNLTDN